MDRRINSLHKKRWCNIFIIPPEEPILLCQCVGIIPCVNFGYTWNDFFKAWIQEQKPCQYE